ncbi:type VI secretion system tube protein TssD [uncultured Lacinutrix sp.]|uniref:type VI secretion system tube protein TssD n=1 Tax=uncultured Lacinutrix sp. TaxID=574032 RepID=UPI00261DC487|nr:type VI secretion system tube protein TssD [uncultured Lacinutrix sp.]
MSFLAKLNIDDQEYNVLSFSFDVAQQIHHGSARPSGMPIINHLYIQIESTSNSGFFGWSISAYEQKDGEIIFYKRDAMASSRTLKFTGAFCINYNEAFESNSANPMVTSLVLAVESIDLDDSTYTNPAVENNQ